MPRFDVLIVGAGIIGAAAARACARSGLHVGIAEGAVVGGATTAAGMGHIVVMDDSPAQLALTAYSRQLWQQERPTLPRAVEYEERGTVWVAADAEEMAEVHAKHATFTAAGIRCSILSAIQLAAEEPNLRPGLASGLLVHDDAVVYPPFAARYFLDQAQQAGAVLLPGRVASAANGELRFADGREAAAQTIVLATGADSTLLPALPLERRKGHLALTDRYPGFAAHQLLELGYLKSAHQLTTDSVAFNVQPRSTGQVLIGSSRQYGSHQPDCEPAMLERMLARAVTYMPALAGLSIVRTWTGFRAATRDKLPLLGPAAPFAADDSLWLAAGFEGLGITNAPAAGRLLADQLLCRASAIDPTPYLPARLSAMAAPLTPPEPAHA